MKFFSRASFALVVALGLSAPRTGRTQTSCSGADVAVNVGAVLPATMHGTLCLPDGGAAHTVQVLVPGATYNHVYWDFPHQPEIYSYRRAMNAAGYATFVVDRLGTGQSARPLSALLNASTQAAAVHDVIQALRAGNIQNIRFSKVILGGHSLGSAITILEAGTYHDEDGVMLTGLTHHISVTGAASLFLNSFYPAFLDPAFAGKGYDPAYLTTRPGTRRADFYAPATTDPNVLAVDEATKDVFATTEAVDGLGIAEVLPYTALIDVPVMMTAGDHDGVVCDPLLLANCRDAPTLRATEKPYFSQAACLQTYVLAGSGHDLNLATNTRDYQVAMRAWADAFVGAGAGRASPPPGACDP